MIGLDDAGKTSLVNRLKRRELPAGVLPVTVTTIGSTIETIPYRRHSVTVWEFGGSDKVRPLWRRYFWHAHGFVFTLDAAAPARFAEAKEELQRMWEEIGDMHPALVLANKVDLPGAVELGEIEEALGVAALAGSGRKIALKGISAMTGEGMDEALEWFVENISHQLIAETNEHKKHMVQAW
ncbi:ADP-ribosylation factor family-domain-containing protein [Mycena capillaripes]|nr:ADP-ribosylation factor family-domain-containing protein [Mycena capillaripes]